MKISSLAALEISLSQRRKLGDDTNNFADPRLRRPPARDAALAAALASHRQRRDESAEHEQRHARASAAAERPDARAAIAGVEARAPKDFALAVAAAHTVAAAHGAPLPAAVVPHAAARSRDWRRRFARRRAAAALARRAGRRRGRHKGVLDALAAAADGRPPPCGEDFLADADGVAAVRRERRRPAAAHARRDAVGAAVAARRVARTGVLSATDAG